MEMSRYQTDFVYDPNHPMNVEDRKNDPDDGIDYDEIIMTTEADFRAGRGIRFQSHEEFSAWLDAIYQEVMSRPLHDRAAS